MIKLKDFPHKKQKSLTSCGYATLSMLFSYFGINIAENEIHRLLLFKKFGLFPCFFMRKFRKNLPNYEIEEKIINNNEPGKIIIEQIKKGFPVPFLYYVVFKSNPSLQGLHYSIIIGIDENLTKVEIADPQPDETDKVISLKELIYKMSFRNISNKNFITLMENLALYLGIVKKNTIFIINKKY